MEEGAKTIINAVANALINKQGLSLEQRRRLAGALYTAKQIPEIEYADAIILIIELEDSGIEVETEAFGNLVNFMLEEVVPQ